MSLQRFFYVTQDSLTVWLDKEGTLTIDGAFSRDTRGCSDFSNYLQKTQPARSVLIADVIEEEFTHDHLPKLSRGDRDNLVKRRLAKRFAATPYRNAFFLGKNRRQSDRFNAIYHALTNQELIDPWLNVIAANKIPLLGITSIPLLSVEMLKRIGKLPENALLMTTNQGGRLRQVFVKAGQPMSARLSRVIDSEGEEFWEELLDKISQSRKYLERSKHIDADEMLDVYIVGNVDQPDVDNSNVSFRAHFVDPASVARTLDMAQAPSQENLEVLFFALCQRKRPTMWYAGNTRQNYARLQRVNQAISVSAIVLAVCCSAIAGWLVPGAISQRNSAVQMETQIAQLKDSFRREHKEFESIRANSHEMKLVVDTGDFVLQNRLPIDWAMRQVAGVVDGFDQIHVAEIAWKIVPPETETNDRRQRGRGNEPVPVPVTAIQSISVELRGEIRPFNGSMRGAFALIDRFAEALQQRTDFDHVAVVDYPIDARPAATLTGEVSRRSAIQGAQFGLRLTRELGDESS